MHPSTNPRFVTLEPIEWDSFAIDQALQKVVDAVCKSKKTGKLIIYTRELDETNNINVLKKDVMRLASQISPSIYIGIHAANNTISVCLTMQQSQT